MQESIIIEGTKELILKAEAKCEETKGGMDTFLTTLEDSDTFHSEAFYNGRLKAFRLMEEHAMTIPDEVDFESALNTIWQSEFKNAKDSASQAEGGMDKFLDDLEESQEFYEEAFYDGKVDAFMSIGAILLFILGIAFAGLGVWGVEKSFGIVGI